MTRLVLGLLMMLPLAASGDPAPPAAPPAPPAGKRMPPKAAFDACAKAKQGDTCTFKGRMDRTLNGTCETPRAGGQALVCRPDRHGGGDGSGSAH